VWPEVTESIDSNGSVVRKDQWRKKREWTSARTAKPSNQLHGCWNSPTGDYMPEKDVHRMADLHCCTFDDVMMMHRELTFQKEHT
jgi:hypothetical protein